MTRRGFTLLEVMVAIAILGLALTAIFSSEVGASNVAQRAKRQNVATTLARCKMGEIEELVSIEGLPLVEKEDSDNCCEHAPVDGYECSWLIERVVLPEFGTEEFGADGEEADDVEVTSEQQNRQRLNESYESIVADGNTAENVVAGDAGNLSVLALQLAYPLLKPFFEEQVRRATVSVRWKEGNDERGFDVVQFLVSDQPPRADDAEDSTTEDGT
ncbi:MAG: type II secretion system protein [Myxococcota bacterium]